MLTPEQTEKVKQQLIQQIGKSFPDDKKEFAISQIHSMDSEKLEGFLKQNKLMMTEDSPQGCVFCSIVNKTIHSHVIGENSKAIAVLELNPVSEGHALVIPKEHIGEKEKVPALASSLVKKIVENIKTKLKPKKVSTESANLFGHEIINIIPIYGNHEPTERAQAQPEELERLEELLKDSKKDVLKVPKPSKPKKVLKNIKLPKRIP